MIIVGWEATEMWKWDPVLDWWGWGSSLAYLDLPVSGNVFVVGVYLSDVETAGVLDCAVAEPMSDWDWMPDTGHFTFILEPTGILREGLYAGGSDPGVVYEYFGGGLWAEISPDLGKAVLSLVEYDGELYAGVMSYEGIGEVYRYDGVNWDQVGGDMDAQVSSLVVWNGELYAGTVPGARLLRYNSLTDTWTEVLAGALPVGIRTMYVWEQDNALYLGDFDSDLIGRYDGVTYQIVSAFALGVCISDFQSYDGDLYASAGLGFLYRSPDGFNWEVEDQFDPDRNIWSLEVFKGYLYLGMDWIGIGAPEAQLWMYNGTLEELVWFAPVTNPGEGIISMTTNGSVLFIGLGGEEGYYGSTGIGQVYSYDGVEVQLISDVMGEGVQVLSFVQVGMPCGGGTVPDTCSCGGFGCVCPAGDDCAASPSPGDWIPCGGSVPCDCGGFG
ncbi:MAG: hypothetical protein HWN51_01100, partial [Desulfobacterales bacterium]|nr:hypothetical protein [Desulfobacterales bacterium]